MVRNKCVASHSPAIFAILGTTFRFRHFMGGPGCLSMRVSSCIKCGCTALVPPFSSHDAMTWHYTNTQVQSNTDHTNESISSCYLCLPYQRNGRTNPEFSASAHPEQEPSRLPSPELTTTTHMPYSPTTGGLDTSFKTFAHDHFAVTRPRFTRLFCSR